jgi:acyl dehydratase
MVSQHHAVITDEMVKRARSRIGKPWKPDEKEIPFRPYNPFNTQATRDTIRHFVNAVGDMNPLYRDPEYAKKTRYGRLIAPGCFLISVNSPTGQAGQLPGIEHWYAGNEFEWFKPILEGDEYTYDLTLVEMPEKKSGSTGARIFIPRDECVYRNQRNEVVAKIWGWGFLMERAAASNIGKYKHIKKTEYTKEELDKIDSDYDKEVIRGAKPRYWEDVQVGEELTPIVKGPHTIYDVFAHVIGFGSVFFRAYDLRRVYLKEHPNALIYDETLDEYVMPEMPHVSDALARQLGAPGAYDYGPGRIAFLGQLLSHWMGDDGFLWKLRAELRQFLVIGDTCWCKGKVTKKYVENDEYCVDIDCWAENQRGENIMPGHATVILPSRTVGTWPVEKRMG